MNNTLIYYTAYYLPLILAAIGAITWLNKLSGDVKTAKREIVELKDNLKRIENNWRDELRHFRQEMNDQFGYQRGSLDKMYEILTNKRD